MRWQDLTIYALPQVGSGDCFLNRQGQGSQSPTVQIFGAHSDSAWLCARPFETVALSCLGGRATSPLFTRLNCPIRPGDLLHDVASLVLETSLLDMFKQTVTAADLSR